MFKPDQNILLVNVFYFFAKMFYFVHCVFSGCFSDTNATTVFCRS